MARPRREERNGRLFCPGCHQWKHHNRYTNTGSASTPRFRSRCKACEQTGRNEKKNEDRARSLIEGRASKQARISEVTKEFIMDELNHEALIPIMRALMGADGQCISCGDQFLNERDIQIEHRAPPRSHKDWARLHARNIALDCASCNGAKGVTPYEQWLDEQEDVRLSVAAYHQKIGVIRGDASQMQLFA